MMKIFKLSIVLLTLLHESRSEGGCVHEDVNKECQVEGVGLYGQSNLDPEFQPNSTVGFKCDFEKGSYCGMLNSSVFNDSVWENVQNSEVQMEFGVFKDHTLKTELGHFLFLRAASTSGNGSGIQLPEIPSPACVSFWYILNAKSFLSFSVNKKDYSIIEETTTEWTKSIFTLNQKNVTEVMFYADVSQIGRFNYIALDDVEIRLGECLMHEDQLGALCTFQTDCGYTNETASDFNWRRAQQMSDHTLGTPFGYFLYIGANSEKIGQKARVVSPKYTAISDFMCFKFFYHLEGERIGTVNIWVRNAQGENLMWTRSRNYLTATAPWDFDEATLIVQEDEPFQVVLEGILGNETEGGMALDDIRIVNGICPFSDYNKCKFDGLSECIWQNDPQNEINWDLIDPKSEKDVPYNSYGNFMMLRTKQKPGTKGRFQSDFIPSENDFRCLTFRYYLSGSLSLKVLMKSNNITNTLWSFKGSQGSRWYSGLVPFHDGKELYQLIFEGIDIKSTKGQYLAIDDIEIKKSSCELTPKEADPMKTVKDKINYDFEKNSLLWKNQSVSGGITWRRGSAQGAFKPSGTTNSYGFLEFNSSIYYNLKSELFSGSVVNANPFQTMCLSFRYYLFGANAGSLQLMLEDLSNNQTKVGNDVNSIALWKRTGSQVDSWTNISLNIIHLPTKFKLNFTAILGSSGIIAIDDILISTGECQQLKGCDFEGNMCGWYSDHRSKTQWRMTNARERPSPLLPTIDHSMKTTEGHYAYVNTNLTGSTFQLLSPLYREGFGAQCLQFWYTMYGESDASLNVFKKLQNSATVVEPSEWTHDKKQYQNWRFAQITINEYRAFQIVFQFSQSSNKEEWNNEVAVALDDISIEMGPCLQWDLCTFDKNTCGFVSNANTKDGINWLRGFGRISQPNVLKGPPTDHTSGEGYYMYVDFANNATHQNRTQLISEDVEKLVCVKLWYYILGTGTGYLSLGIEGSQDKDIIIINKTSQWQKYQKIVSGPASGKFIIEAVKEKGDVFIAVDDIILSSDSLACQDFQEPTTSPTIETNPDFSCDFENGSFCQWTVEGNSRNIWKIYHYGDVRSNLQLKYDHTKGNYLGKYAFYTTWYQPVMTMGRLVSPSISKTGRYCFQFWYFVNSAYNSVFQVLLNNSHQEDALWIRNVNQGPAWKMAQIDVYAWEREKIIFSVVVMKDYEAVMGVDDISLTSGPCRFQKICSFDSGEWCGFINMEENPESNQWMHTPVMGTAQMKMAYDHTTNSPAGGYLYVNKSDSFPSESKLFSPIYEPTENSCVKLWFYKKDKNAKLTISTNNQILAEIQDYFGDKWIPLTLSVQSEQYWLIEIKSYSTNNTVMAMGIDDFEVLDGPCESIDFCDFETGMCLWEDSLSSKYHWQRGSAIENKGTTLPYNFPVDHTLHSTAGYMIFIQNKYQSSEMRAELYSRIFQKSELQNGLCLSLWYYCSETDVGALDFSTFNDQYTIGFVQPTAARKWNKKEFNVTNVDADLQITLIFKAKGKPGLFAVDDIQFHKGICKDSEFQCRSGNTSIQVSQVCDFTSQCLDGSDEVNCGNCSFDKSDCGFTNIGLLSWQKNDPNDEKLSAKIPYDHTQGKGNFGRFLYFGFNKSIESPSLAKQAILLSPKVQNSSPNCHLIFWQMIYFEKDRTSQNILKVSLMTENHPDIIIWQNELSDLIWQRVTLPIGRIESVFRIKFEATSNSNNPEIIVALDDVSLQHCNYPLPVAKCPESYFRCNNSACVDSSRICDLTDDCGDGSDESQCENRKLYDFEDNSFGEWLQSTNDNSNVQNKWIISKATTELFTPPRDHTLGNVDGKFVIKKTKRSPTSKLATYRLIGPYLKGSTECKMRFNYFIYGNNGVFLSVLTNNTGNEKGKLNWKRTDPTGQYFVRDLIQFNEAKSFQVIFEATFGNDTGTQSIALDDISFDEHCETDNSTVPTTSPPTPPKCDEETQFECKSSECVDIVKRCDFTDDCQDASDEVDCAICQFDRNSCGWEDNSYGKYRWIRSKVPNSLPKLKDLSKNIMTIQHFPPGDFTNSLVILETSEINAKGARCTMEFSYFLNRDDANLELHFKHRNGMDIFISSFSSVTKWKQQFVHLGQIPNGYRIRFVAAVNSSAPFKTQLKVAITDVNFHDCASDVKFDRADLNCTFEEESCEWFQEYIKDDFDWSKGSGATQVKGTGPEMDHSNPDGSGHYMYIESFGKNVKEEKAWLVSSPIQSVTTECFVFWYHMFGMDVNRLNVYKRELENGREVLIWTKMFSQGNVWKQAEIELNYHSNNSYQIIFEGILGKRKSDIALDDFALLPGRCQFKSFCDFEIDSCNWMMTGQLTKTQWMLGRNGKNDLRSGPFIDHTTGTSEGYYAFVYTDKKPLNEPARFHSPTFPKNTEEHCFRFFYYVDGCKENSYLNVYLKNESGEYTLQKIEADKSSWQETNIRIFSDTEYQIIMEGIITSSCGCVAIDDIMILDSPCPPENSCDFEHDTCSWNNINSVRWLRNSGGTPSDFTGPAVDHTYGTSEGYYLFLDSSNGRTGDTALLESRTLSLGPTVCFKIWYYMSGKGVAKLTVKIKSQVEVFNISGHQDNKWLLADIQLHNLSTSYIIQVAAIRGDRGIGDIAIDDLSITKGSCQEESIATTVKTIDTTSNPPTQCQTGFIQCNLSNEHCIPYIYWCDGVEDCPNGEDEVDGCQNECLHNLTYEQICDGSKDCSDGSDEIICDCRDDFCRNGTCTKEMLHVFCKCEDGFKGKRCESTSPLETSSSGLGKGSVAGIVMGVLLIIVTGLCIAGLYYRKKVYLRNNESNSIDNPMYSEFNEEDYRDFSVLGASTSVSELRDTNLNEDGFGSTNPTYDVIRNIEKEFHESEIQ